MFPLSPVVNVCVRTVVNLHFGRAVVKLCVRTVVNSEQIIKGGASVEKRARNDYKRGEFSIRAFHSFSITRRKVSFP